MPAPDVTLFGSRFSRTFVARWMLEEIGLPYRFEETDIGSGAQKSAAYLKINPMGKVPALVDDGVTITETNAICLYLADRYAYGDLAPKIEAPERGPYLRWAAFATGVMEPATFSPETQSPDEARHNGWGERGAMLATLEHALTPGPFLLGARFSAADVALGGLFTIALFNKRLPARPTFAAYNEAIGARPAYQRAAAATWPPVTAATSVPPPSTRAG